jgi:hypothetical protein
MTICRPVVAIAVMFCAISAIVLPAASQPVTIPEIKKKMDDIGAKVDIDWEGERGQSVRAICNKLLDIRAPVMSVPDVLRIYGRQKADAWGDCVLKLFAY